MSDKPVTGTLEWMNGMSAEAIRLSHAAWSRESDRLPLKCRTVRECFLFDGYFRRFTFFTWLHFLFPIFRERNEAVCIRLQQLYWYRRLRHAERGREEPIWTWFPFSLWYYLRLAYLVAVATHWKSFLQRHFNTQVSPFADIGPGLRLNGNSNLQISALVRIGRNYQMGANNTIVPNDRGWPVIGNCVTLWSNSVVIGKVKIGDRAIIGAGAVVTKDVPADATAVGVPARVIKMDGAPLESRALDHAL